MNYVWVGVLDRCILRIMCDDVLQGAAMFILSV